MKERLVGAAVLVAIGAWLIPWVLDGPEQIAEPAATALDLPAPSAESPPIRTETVALDRRELPTPTSSSAPSAASSAPAARDADAVTAAATTAAASAESSPASPAPAPSEPAVAGETQWYVQVGAFGDQDNAERQAARVGTFGFDAHVSAFPGGSGVVHRVRVGPQVSRERAEAIASSLSAHGFVAQVVFE